MNERILTLLLLTVFPGFALLAQDEPTTELSAVAERYVAAYNEKDLDAITALFTPQAAMIDEIDGLTATGDSAIREIFEKSFNRYPDRRISLDVIEARKIAENVVVEEGIARFSGEVPNEEGDAIAYSAVLVKDTDKGWLIAESRELGNVAPAHDPLADLSPLLGDWVLHGDQMQMDLSFEISPSGRFLIGSAVVTTPSDGTMQTDLRIGYDASLSQVRWWTFDELGGFAQGVWQPLEDGSWLVRTNGVTAQGEPNSAIQTLAFETGDSVVWKSSHRFLDGQPLQDTELRLVRRPPAPSVTLDDSGDAAGADRTATDSSTGTEKPTESKPKP